MVYRKILIIGTKGISSNIMFNFLENKQYDSSIVIEESISSVTLVKNRIKKLGLIKVIGQLMFQVGIAPVLKVFSQGRANEIMGNYNLDKVGIASNKIQYVKTVNSQEMIDIILRVAPELILLSGCRIVSNKTLGKIDIPIVNIHVGITPQYRGVHGGYWAIRSKDQQNFGVTLHYVDAGIDTGNVIAQKQIKFDPKDNFTTYPILQIAEGLILLKDFIENNSKVNLDTENKKSSLWYHPTAWGYLFNKLFNGVK
ncbi:MAG: folate-dependent phosphoribosylglycinamide formyltransferase PurN [Patiriisocius sp.]|jgi:folate-dependent phosphoribosylglycinamide formyltransferase PurN